VSAASPKQQTNAIVRHMERIGLRSSAVFAARLPLFTAGAIAISATAATNLQSGKPLLLTKAA